MNDTEIIPETKAKPKKKWYKRWFSIVALGSLWVPIFLFICNIVKDDAPTRRLSFMYSNLQDNYVNGKMHTSFFVTISNGGKSSFQIMDSVKAKIWYIPINRLTKENHFDWEQYMNTTAYDRIFYTTSYVGEYGVGDSVKNSFDFFIDSIKADSLKYAILARADAHFKTPRFLWSPKIDSDFCYYALIRFKTVDSASMIKNFRKKKQN